jgi:hypothetical protein
VREHSRPPQQEVLNSVQLPVGDLGARKRTQACDVPIVLSEDVDGVQAREVRNDAGGRF